MRQRDLADLLAAERALARLGERLSASPGRRHRWRHDHARRAALAVTTLAGRRADPGAFLLTLADPSRGDPDAAWTHAAWSLATTLREPVFRLDRTATPDQPPPLDPRMAPERRRRLLAGLGREEGPMADGDGDDPPTPTRGRPGAKPVDVAADLVARSWALLAETDDILNAPSPPEVAEPKAPHAAIEPLPPWTVDWYDEVRRRWAGALGGRAPPLTAEGRATAGAVLGGVEAALAGVPGLPGVAHAVRLLLTAPEPASRRRPFAPRDADDALAHSLVGTRDPDGSLWSLLAWLGSGLLIARACGVEVGVAPCLAPALARGTTGFRLALEDGGVTWEGWLTRAACGLAEAEMERAAALDQIQTRWEERVDLGSRRSTSRLPAALRWLHGHPAWTTAVMERTLGPEAGLSRRGVYLLAAELRDAGVVRDGTPASRHGAAPEVDRLWIATALVPEPPGGS